jgi:pyrroloquinoline quinone (PQQ) biosynthesis protein C
MSLDREFAASQPALHSSPLDGALNPELLHIALSDFNRSRLEPRLPESDWMAEIHAGAANALMEGHFLEAERAEVRARAARVPTDPDGFVAWFEELKVSGPGQGHPLFQWLAESASYEQMRWFVRQEVAGEAGFDDLVALTQVRLAEQPKLELARNYWDEMGRGKAIGMHGPMLGELAKQLGVTYETDSRIIWEARALSNVLVGLAANRRYAYQSIGALGVIELTAPTRAGKVATGLERLGMSKAASRYFRLHATLDLEHSASWNREVLRPLVDARPDVAVSIAEGALMRLCAGARCFERYCRELGVSF